MASLIYTRGKALFSGSTDWASSEQTFGLLLASSAYEPHKSHRFVSEVAHELSGVGYSRKELVGRTVEQNDSDDRADCLADAVTYRQLSTKQSYQWAIIYKIGKTDTDAQLICAIDMGDVSLKGIAEHKIRWSGKDESGRVFSLV
jgi:hypothetical protein